MGPRYRSAAMAPAQRRGRGDPSCVTGLQQAWRLRWIAPAPAATASANQPRTWPKARDAERIHLDAFHPLPRWPASLPFLDRMRADWRRNAAVVEQSRPQGNGTRVRPSAAAPVPCGHVC